MHLNGLNIVICGALTVGHAALVVLLINRVNASAIAAAVVAYPAPAPRSGHWWFCRPCFGWYFGFDGPKLFFEVADVASSPRGDPGLPLPVCAVVALSLPVITLYRISRRPANQISNQSRIVDMTAELGFRPLGRGLERLVLRLPGNQSLKVEVSAREFWLPRLPQDWDGLSILHLTDLHFTGRIGRPFFEQLVKIAGGLPADLIVFTGDLLDREDLIEWLPATLGKLNAPLGCYFVLGNHDSYMKNVGDVRHRLGSLGWHDVASRSRVVENRGRPLVVCGSELPWMGAQPDLAQAPQDAFRLFLSHTPDNIRWARRNNIDLMLAGHNHGGQIRLPLFGPVYSPSAYGAHYASGVFWQDPMMLYVSRGISAKIPLRWNCLPELTRLTLRCAVADRHAVPAGEAVAVRT